MARRKPLPQALESARLKLKRANLHANVAEREAIRFFDTHGGASTTIEAETDTDVPVGGTLNLRLIVNQGMPPLPDSYSARFGDAIHNYRCVLDHIAWQLVLHGSLPRPSRPDLVQFPIASTLSGFNEQRERRLPGVRYLGGPAEFIQARHRYQRGKATNQTLLSLAKLSNDDKHRSLHLAVSAIAQAHHIGKFTQCRPIGFRSPAGPPPRLEAGTVMAYFTIEVTGPDAQVEMDHDLAAYVALEDGSNLMDVLHETCREITEILYAPEIATGL
jgi:hypothetical protein